jgi:hypothetical protein
MRAEEWLGLYELLKQAKPGRTAEGLSWRPRSIIWWLTTSYVRQQLGWSSSTAAITTLTASLDDV